MQNLKTLNKVGLGQFAIAFGLVYLATALVFIGYEAASIRKQIPQLVAGLKSVEAMPQSHPLLARIDKALIEIPLMTGEFKAIRQQIPQILEESAAIRAALPPVLEEISQVRAAMVPVLAESAALRAELPVAIENARKLVGGAKKVAKGIGQGAAKGAVEGTVKGIISAPFEVLKQGASLVIPDGDKQEASEEADKE
jgi:hypothetical protein